MAKLKPELRSARRRVRLTAEEFASLKEVGNRPMQRHIPDEHRDRLIAVGYVREIVPYWGAPHSCTYRSRAQAIGGWQIGRRSVCKLGLEGIVSKKSKAWLKIKNPKAPAATRTADGTF
jgi:hypothetical protein